MRTILFLLLVLASCTHLSAQPLNSFYQNKKVLSIGARQTVLEAFSSRLEEEGFQAEWTNLCNDTAAVTKKFHARHYDVITFGRGLSEASKTFYREKFLAQNPALVFVEGLAPIASLLVDQVKYALLPAGAIMPGLEWTDRQLTVNAQPLHLVVKHYRLNWMFRASEKKIFEGDTGLQRKEIPFSKKGGRNFITITCNGLVVAIRSL